MADTASDSAPLSGLPARPAAPKRVHSYSRLNTAVAVLALATAAYALWRLDTTRDRLDSVNDIARELQADRDGMRAEIANLASRERQARAMLERRLDALNDVPARMQELQASLEELHGRTEGPERAWSRAEALFLMEIAQRSLTLERDVATAVAALEPAAVRLGAVRDPALTPIRQSLAREISALRAVPLPDLTGLLARLAGAEEQAGRIAVKGIVAVEREDGDTVALPTGMLARARELVSRALASLITVRKVQDRDAALVSVETQQLRRQHLQLLLFTARSAAARHDGLAYRDSLGQARRWLAEFFDLNTPAAAALLTEVQALEPVNVDPPLPDISASARALQRLTPVRKLEP